jgi:ribosome-associated heat shock protein Hsp15
MESLRIDKWLWAARFFKTRSLATDEINHGRVQMEQHDVKPSREIRVGDAITIVQARIARTVVVKGLSDQRGPAPVAQQLYEETPDSLLKRTLTIEHNRLNAEPALSIAHGRPTKRDRRELQKNRDAQ